MADMVEKLLDSFHCVPHAYGIYFRPLNTIITELYQVPYDFLVDFGPDTYRCVSYKILVTPRELDERQEEDLARFREEGVRQGQAYLYEILTDMCNRGLIRQGVYYIQT